MCPSNSSHSDGPKIWHPGHRMPNANVVPIAGQRPASTEPRRRGTSHRNLRPGSDQAERVRASNVRATHCFGRLAAAHKSNRPPEKLRGHSERVARPRRRSRSDTPLPCAPVLIADQPPEELSTLRTRQGAGEVHASRGFELGDALPREREEFLGQLVGGLETFGEL